MSDSSVTRIFISLTVIILALTTAVFIASAQSGESPALVEMDAGREDDSPLDITLLEISSGILKHEKYIAAVSGDKYDIRPRRIIKKTESSALSFQFPLLVKENIFGRLCLYKSYSQHGTLL